MRVWAPRARSLVVVENGSRTAMFAGAGRWWEGPALPIGVDYQLSVDGHAPQPDPRSRWQPEGVHGPSRTVEPRALGGDPLGFVAVPFERAIVYELHVGTFSEVGTFVGAIHHLDHLVALGVTHVELMPIAQFPGVHGWGYDGVAPFAAHAPYGGPSGLHALIHACHKRGLAVIVDVVHNHVGPEGNYLDQLAPYHSARHKTPWGDGINFDGDGSREVRRFFIDSALAWIADYHVDGLRLDALHAIVDDSPVHVVAELAAEVAALAGRLGREIVLVGEYDGHVPYLVDPRERGGFGLRGHWDDDFHHALHVLLAGETTGYYAKFAAPDALVRVLEDGYAGFGDRPRDRLVGFTQSHDQIGNRAGGERLVHLVGERRARIAAAILMVSPFVPMLFQGEEWAASTPFLYFCELSSPELRAAVRAGRASEHGAAGAIDPTSPRAHERSVLVWSELERDPHARMLSWYRALIEARLAIPTLRDPRAGATRASRRGALLDIARGDHALVVNLGDEPARAALGEVLLASEDLASAHELPPLACALVVR
jgi:maltooligosyltrehalose trehalohydrolase